MPRYEQIGRLTGVSTPPFSVVRRAEVLKMKHMVLEYMESVLDMQKQLKANGTVTEGNTTGVTGGITTGVGVKPFAPEHKFSLGQTDDGFPVLQRPMNTQGWTKRDWESLHMEYMSCHYSEWKVGLRRKTGIHMTI
jgi:hypothetical protein